MKEQSKLPPGALITFIPSTRQLDIIGYHPDSPDLKITSMVSCKRKSSAEECSQTHERTEHHIITMDRECRTDIILDIKETRYYSKDKDQKKNFLHASVSHLSFNAGKPIILPVNKYTVMWTEDPKGDLVELSQVIMVENAYRQETHYNAAEDMTYLKLDVDGKSTELSVGGLMVAHRCVSPPGLWVDGKVDARVLHGILRKHVRTEAVELSEAESRVQHELDTVFRTAHIKSCETCISDFSDLKIY